MSNPAIRFTRLHLPWVAIFFLTEIDDVHPFMTENTRTCGQSLFLHQVRIGCILSEGPDPRYQSLPAKRHHRIQTQNARQGLKEFLFGYSSLNWAEARLIVLLRVTLWSVALAVALIPEPARKPRIASDEPVPMATKLTVSTGPALVREVVFAGGFHFLYGWAFFGTPPDCWPHGCSPM